MPWGLCLVQADLAAKCRSKNSFQNFSKTEGLLPFIVKEDQTGFIKGRNSYNNIRRLLNIIQLSEQQLMDGLVISLDAEKAFDHEWSYLFFTLAQFGLGDGFVKWVKCPIYPANGCSHNQWSTVHKCYGSTQTGLPFIPLLFTVLIEPLAEAIRKDPLMAWLDVGKKSHKIALYADDMLLFMFNPSVAVSRFIQIIARFAAFSGYKVNLFKSEAMPLGNLQQLPDNPNPFPFKWSPAGFIYWVYILHLNFIRSFKQSLSHY